MHRVLAAILAAAVPIGVASAQHAPARSLAPLVRMEGGMLNPSDPLAVTMAYGGALGLSYRRHALVLRVVRQSANRNSGPDLTSNARLFRSVSWEYQGTPEGILQRQGILRLGVGRVTRNAFRTAWFLDAAIAFRYRLATPVAVIGTLQYMPVFIPEEQFVYCGPGEGPYSYQDSCRDAMVARRIQHNLGFLMGVEARFR
jgi:hypothetical protein